MHHKRSLSIGEITSGSSRLIYGGVIAGCMDTGECGFAGTNDNGTSDIPNYGHRKSNCAAVRIFAFGVFHFVRTINLRDAASINNLRGHCVGHRMRDGAPYYP